MEFLIYYAKYFPKSRTIALKTHLKHELRTLLHQSLPHQCCYTIFSPPLQL